MPLPSAEILTVPALLHREQILRSMGILSGRSVKNRLLRHVDEAVERVAAEACPRLAWLRGTAGEIFTVLDRSRRLDRYLAEADHVVIMAATAGREMDALILSEADPMRRYVLSVASTALTRYALEFAESELNERFPMCSTGKPLSPGNDGLPLGLQRCLIKLLPIDAIGIGFDDGLKLMTPLASITAIIGLGSYERSEGEGCRSCPSPNCPIRLHENLESAPRHALTPTLSTN